MRSYRNLENAAAHTRIWKFQLAFAQKCGMIGDRKHERGDVRMLSRVRSMGLNGIRGYEVSVECYITNGLPGFEIVGLPDAAVKEARERVRAAVKNCGVKFPVSRITVNLAPAGLKKEGTLYDLPILLGILACAEEIKPPARDAAFVGELSLTGQKYSFLLK